MIKTLFIRSDNENAFLVSNEKANHRIRVELYILGNRVYKPCRSTFTQLVSKSSKVRRSR